MGFRDLRQFNDALLGKQVWRLFHEKDTLLYKVFKSKFFPNGSILDVEIKPRCSFAWKSILQARDVICKGARWRIGDGSSIKIWEHRWLEGAGEGKILSPYRDPSLAVVKDLFLPGTKCWNEELIDRCFFQSEAECIKSSPVSAHTSADLLIWPLSLDGKYTVRSAYRLLASESLNSQPGTSNSEGLNQLWLGIWKLQVPNKVRHFIWRASSESLPTRGNLRRRHVIQDNVCSLCDDHPEDIIHCLWLCDHVKCIWFSDSAFICLRSKRFTKFSDLVSVVHSELSQASAALFSMVAWCIWTRRNKVREGQEAWGVGETVKRARELLLEFQAVNRQRSQSGPTTAEVKWSPPTPGLFKINFDGAVFANLGWAGLGVVIRDAAGRIIAALSQKILLPSSVDLVEALAVRRALSFAQEISIFQAVVEGDSLKVISALNNPKEDRSHIGHIIQDIKYASHRMQVSFFTHVRRGGNKLAHALAKRAVLAADLDVWLEDLPPDLEDVFQIDFVQ